MFVATETSAPSPILKKLAAIGRMSVRATASSCLFSQAMKTIYNSCRSPVRALTIGRFTYLPNQRHCVLWARGIQGWPGIDVARKAHSTGLGAAILLVAFVFVARNPTFVIALAICAVVATALYLAGKARQKHATTDMTEKPLAELISRVPPPKTRQPSLSPGILPAPYCTAPVQRAAATQPVVVRVAQPELRGEAIPASPEHSDGAFAPRWITFGERTQFDRWQLKGGGIYVGNVPSYPRTPFSDEPALMDPTLPVDTRAPDLAGTNIGYYPSYARLKPNERGAYLAFLQSGRQLKAFGISYVFLYYYGLERRLLIDGQIDPLARAEAPRLIGEIDRLLSVYGSASASFHHYATELRDFARGLYASDDDAPPRVEIFPGAPPASLVLGIARRIGSAKPLPSAWARAWTSGLSSAPRFSQWRSVAKEICELFDLRYRAKYGDGLVIAAKPSHLKVPFRGAAFDRLSLRFETDLPDPNLLDEQFVPLLDLFKTVISDLEPLRAVRRQKAAGVIAELMAMPTELRSAEDPPAVLASLADHVHCAIAGNDHAVVSVADLRTWVEQDASARVTRRQLTAVTQALHLIGAVSEPDFRAVAAPGDRVVLMKDSDVASPSLIYDSAVAVLRLAYGVISADGIVAHEEREATIEQVSTLFNLSPLERRRLNARLTLIDLAKPKLTKLLHNARKLAKENRATIARVLVVLAHADGRVDPSEVRLLERIYKSLALDPSEVPNDLHVVATGSDNAGRGSGVTLDRKVIAAKVLETADVQKLLAAIFSEVDETTGSPTASKKEIAAPSVPNISGLDAAHSGLVRHIINVPSEQLERTRFEQWCEAAGLLPDGAIEVINEMAYNVADAPLLEGDDTFTIDASARKALQSAIKGACA
jgi:uncharacterized tellurite resistance protein B-like protein